MSSCLNFFSSYSYKSTKKDYKRIYVTLFRGILRGSIETSLNEYS